ncbi:Rad52/Rad22 family DNA repair protein [Methylobacterium sp. Gmos1]
MSFTDKQLAALNAPLDRKHVKGRTQAGRTLSYVEGWHAIAEANRIFGFDAWDRETVDLRMLGERQVGDKSRVAYMARVRITVRAEGIDIVRDGCGYGSGIDKDLGQAHESALKEAETDAMKRALMTFGNPFGLALYDKDQANVVDLPDEPEDPRSSSQRLADDMIVALSERAGARVDRFLGMEQVKRDLEVLDIEDFDRVSAFAEIRRAVKPEVRAA